MKLVHFNLLINHRLTDISFHVLLSFQWPHTTPAALLCKNSIQIATCVPLPSMTCLLFSIKRLVFRRMIESASSKWLGMTKMTFKGLAYTFFLKQTFVPLVHTIILFLFPSKKAPIILVINLRELQYCLQML